MREGGGGGYVGPGSHVARSWATVCVFGPLWLDESQAFFPSLTLVLCSPTLINTPEIKKKLGVLLFIYC